MVLTLGNPARVFLAAERVSVQGTDRGAAQLQTNARPRLHVTTTQGGRGTHTSDLSSRMFRSWSREDPRLPSFRRACAVIRDASAPPLGCCRLRSCATIPSSIFSQRRQACTGKLSKMGGAGGRGGGGYLNKRQRLVGDVF